jgi:hypothetical protein
LMAVDFAIIGSLVRPGRPRYPVLVHRAATLLHAFFRPHLAMIPLRFANPSPPSGWIEDFHLQAVVQYSAHQQEAPTSRGFKVGNTLQRGRPFATQLYSMRRTKCPSTGSATAITIKFQSSSSLAHPSFMPACELPLPGLDEGLPRNRHDCGARCEALVQR